MGQAIGGGALGHPASEALRCYAKLVVEHERVRRLGDAPKRRGPGGGPSRCRPSPIVLPELRRLAFLSDLGRASRPLVEFCGRHPEGEEPLEWVATRGYLAALASALELAGDAILRARLDPPWGAGNPRAPQTAEAFDAVARRLRDLDGAIDRPGSLASAMDRAVLPMPSPDRRRAEPKGGEVVLDAATFVVDFGDARAAIPEGKERDLLRALMKARDRDRIVPPEEPGAYWKGVVDNLRRRLNREAGRGLLSRLVLPARGGIGGYRLSPNVRIIGTAEVGLRFVPPESLDALASRPPSRRHPRADDDD